MSISTPSDTATAELRPELVPAGGLLELLLCEQQVTAVDKFSQWHGENSAPLQARFYRDLIPVNVPAANEQFAFEVDLDVCSGCKACVIACHHLNGLEEGETWRSVGLLHGGTSPFPVLQHVTTTCHHCLEPPCLEGCPVLAYEKEPLTGIVRHLDDQCIGCQYCILKCPYDVPKYSHAKGIVRKCDMCRDRLAAGEAPACVQACPNRAIRIVVVDTRETAENAEANLFLPGAPEPGLTLPTTVYKTRKPMPANLLPADYYSSAPQHAHWPLVFMLVLSQMSVGAFLVDQVLYVVDLARGSDALLRARAVHVGAAFVLGMMGLVASVFHLGRPWLAYRAVIGWRTSWLSREVLAFGGFALSASLYAGIPWMEAMGLSVSATAERALGGLVAATGLTGVACSAMVYASTRRIFWNPAYTGAKFLLTCFILGIPVAQLIRLVTTAWPVSGPSPFPLAEHTRELSLCLASAVAVKLILEMAIFSWLGAKTFTPLRRTAHLMTGDLARTTIMRFACIAVGGLALPGLLMAWHSRADAMTSSSHVAVVAAILVLNLAGEVLERYMFFVAVVAPRMPGAASA